MLIQWGCYFLLYPTSSHLIVPRVPLGAIRRLPPTLQLGVLLRTLVAFLMLSTAPYLTVKAPSPVLERLELLRCLLDKLIRRLLAPPGEEEARSVPLSPTAEIHWPLATHRRMLDVRLPCRAAFHRLFHISLCIGCISFLVMDLPRQ